MSKKFYQIVGIGKDSIRVPYNDLERDENHVYFCFSFEEENEFKNKLAKMAKTGIHGKVSAIQELRISTGAGLKAAKLYIEHLMEL